MLLWMPPYAFFQVTYEQAAKDLEQTRAQQTKELLHQVFSGVYYYLC